MGLLIKLDICPQRELQHILTSRRRYFLSGRLDPHGPTHCVAFSCRHYCGSCSLCILRQCRYRRVHIVIPIPHLHMSLPALLKPVAPIGLCWNRHSDAWGIRIGHLRWFLLRSSAAEVVLVYGKYSCVPLDPDKELPCPALRANRLQILTLSILSSLLVLHPRLEGRKWRNFRAIVFVSTGLSGFAPVIHGVLIYGFDRAWRQTRMPYYLLEGAIFILGATFYAFRFPESVKPGKFDMWGSSHNIFHVLVVIATFVHLAGIWQAFGYHYRYNG